MSFVVKASCKFFSTMPLAPWLRGLNRLAVPFLSEGADDEDYDLLPPPRPLGTLQLLGIAFFAVSGSAFGVEEVVPAAGPFLSLLALLLAPLLWSAPMLLVVAELSVALPRSGGYVVWVEEAFGAMPSLLNGVSNLLCSVLDCSLYPALLTQYLHEVLVLAHSTAADGAAADAGSGAATGDPSAGGGAADLVAPGSAPGSGGLSPAMQAAVRLYAFILDDACMHSCMHLVCSLVCSREYLYVNSHAPNQSVNTRRYGGLPASVYRPDRV